jgi:anti-sigma factor RsiW
MSPICSQIQARFGPYAAEALPADERRAVREHLAVCAACVGEAAAQDPTLLYAAGAPAEELSAQDMARILQGVRAGVAIKRAERRLSRPRRRSAKAAAAAAAVALFTLALPGGLSRPAAPVPMPAAVRAVQASTAPTPAALGRLADQPAASSSTVYEIAPGAGPNEPRVVWVVDRTLDI